MKIELFLIVSSVYHFHCQINAGKNFSLIYKWNTLNFQWKDDEHKAEYLRSKKFVQANCYIREFTIFKEFALITIPRWKTGVPATLTRISNMIQVLPTSPVLEPYPSWSMQEINNCSALQSVHSISIDNENRLWVLDSGLIGKLESNQSMCNPKLVIIDLETNLIIRQVNIPDEMKSGWSSFTSMTLDNERHVLYIADSNNYNSGFVTYDFATAAFHRFTCEQLNVEDENSNTLFIPNNITPDFVSLTLNTDKNKLYFSTFDTTDLLFVNVSVFSQNSTDISSYAMNLGSNGRNVKLISDLKGYIYFDITNQKSIAQWREGSRFFQYSPQITIHSKMLYPWISSLFMDEKTGYLWIVSSRFMNFISNQVNEEKENMRIYRAFVPRKERPSNSKIGGFSLEYVLLASFIVMIGLIIMKISGIN